MKREGTLMSIWQSDMIENPEPIAATNAFDFKIEGSGLIALTVALLLQQQGKNCLLLQDTINTAQFPLDYLSTMQENGYAAFSASAGTEKTTALADSAREAIDLAEQWITEHNIECGFVYEPGFLYTNVKENTAALTAEQLAAEKTGLVVTPVHSIPVPLPFENACRFEFQARLDPVQFYNGLLAAFRKAGGAVAVSTDNATTTATISITQDDINTTQKNSCHIAFTLASGTYPYGIAESSDGMFSFQSAKKDGQEYVIATVLHAGHETAGLEQLETMAGKHFQVADIRYKWSVPYAASGEPFSVKNNGANNFTVANAGRNSFTNSIIAGLVIANNITGTNGANAALFLR